VTEKPKRKSSYVAKNPGSQGPRGGQVQLVATAETRLKGGLAYAEKRRKLKEEARQLLVERMAEKMGRACDVVDDAMEALANGEADHRIRLAGADRVFDRVAGKAAQAVELSGGDGGPMQIVVRSAFNVGNDSGPALLGDGEAERLGEGVD
jgi:hypothetical protein